MIILHTVKECARQSVTVNEEILDPLVVLDFIGLHTNLAREDSVRIDDADGLDAQVNAAGSLHPDVRVSISNTVKHPLVLNWYAHCSSAAIDGPEELALALDQSRLEVQPVRSVQLCVQPGVDEVAGYRVDLFDDSRLARHERTTATAVKATTMTVAENTTSEFKQ